MGYIKTKVYQSDQYTTDSQCKDLARWYAEVDMTLEKSGTIQSLPIYHMNVNTLITLNYSNIKETEKYLVKSYSLNLNPTATINLNVTNVRSFYNWTEVSTEDENE
jgi:hypothetical protein